VAVALLFGNCTNRIAVGVRHSPLLSVHAMDPRPHSSGIIRRGWRQNWAGKQPQERSIVRSGIRLVGLSLLVCACSRGGANRDSAAIADSLRGAAAGATTSIAPTGGDTTRSQASPDSASRSASATPNSASTKTPSSTGGGQQRPSPRDTRPTPPKNPVNSPKLPEGPGVGDTARGTPAVTGTSFQSQVVLQRSGSPSIQLTGPHAKLIGAQSGADVWVEGTRDARGTINVTRFAVRSVDGAPAIDGVLRADGNGLVVVTPDGVRHPLTSPPDALRQHVGSRVWVTGASSGPVVFGVIDKSP
jgi:hypothetical protein